MSFFIINDIRLNLPMGWVPFQMLYLGPFSNVRCMFALEKFTIPDDKQLVIEIAEKEGGRHQSFVVENEDIVRANVIDELSIQ